MINQTSKRAVLFVCMTSSFLTPLMISAVNVALPAIQKDFHIDAVLLAWVATSYILSAAVFLVPFGKASDIFGRRKIYIAGMTVFTAGVRSARELAGHFSSALGREIRVGGTPRLFVKLFGLFVPIVREVDEMLHEWQVPFVVDDRKFRERFGAEPTPIDQAAQATVEWARTAYSGS